MKIKSEQYPTALTVGTYMLSFDPSGENYLFVNFETLAALQEFIEKKGLLFLYNEWLDYINSDYIAEEVNSYFIAKVERVTVLVKADAETSEQEVEYALQIIDEHSKIGL